MDPRDRQTLQGGLPAAAPPSEEHATRAGRPGATPQGAGGQRPRTFVLEDTPLAEPAPATPQTPQTPPTQQTPAVADDPKIGTLVADRYRLLQKLGEGGMGTVYRGEHITLKKPVAVKFLHREMTEYPEMVARFEREAVAAANLDHPNVVAATDFGKLQDGTFFLVMEFVEGRTLRKVMQLDQGMHVARALKILKQVAAALQRAHSLGVVHRDLKPENIVVRDREGERDVVKVIDFGIARVTGSAFGANGPALTQMGTVFGTPEYMAPEQAMGHPADGRADQYALGLIAFELFAMRRPFHAEDAIDLLRMQVGQVPPRVSAYTPSFPRAADDVIARMLAKTPAGRFESVTAAIQALEAGLSQGAVADAGSGPGSAGAFASSTGVRRDFSGSVTPAAPASQGAVGTSGAVYPARGLRSNAGVGIALGLAGLAGLAVVIVLALRSKQATPVVAPVVPRAPIADRMHAYQSQPEVAQAMARLYAGDIQGAAAPLLALRTRNPRDGLAAYFLGTVYWSGRQYSAEVNQFGAALQLEPDLASDSTLARAVVAALEDHSASRSAEALLREGPLARSQVAADAVADEAIMGTVPAGRALALSLAQQMSPQLRPLARARIALRAASNCADLNAALAALASYGPGGAGDDIQSVRAGQCEMLTLRNRCRECFEDDEARAPRTRSR